MDKETEALLKNLQEIIDVIKDALEKDAIKAAFFCSLSIPDIGGQIEYDELRGYKNGIVGERYKKWYDECVFEYENPKAEDLLDFKGTPKMNKIDGSIVYLLRCKLYHQGDASSKEVYEKLISKYQDEYTEKNVELDYRFDAKYDNVRFETVGDNLHVEINVNPKMLAKKLMWNAEGVIRQFNKKFENVEEPT